MIKRKLTKLLIMALCCTAIVPCMSGCEDKISIETANEEAEAADADISASGEDEAEESKTDDNKEEKADDDSKTETDESEKAEKVTIDIDTVANSSSDNFKMVVEKKSYDEVLAYVNGLGGEVKESQISDDTKTIKCRFKNFKGYDHLWFELTYFFDLDGNMDMYTESLTDVSGKDKIYSENIEPLFNALLEHYKEIYGEPQGEKVKSWNPDDSTRVSLQYTEGSVTGTVKYK